MTKKVLAVSVAYVLGCGSSPWPIEGALPAGLSAVRQVDHGPARPPRRFEPRGVGGGGALFGPTISPIDPNELYVGTDMTDLFHSLDFGAHWETIPFTVVQGDSFTSTQFTADPALLYALTNDAVDDPILVKSTDHGKSWSPLLPGTNVNYVSADADSTRRLIAVDNQNVYFSRDAGATFTVVYTSAADDGLVMGGALWHGREIFVGTSDGLLVSRDGGNTFALAPVTGIPAGEGIVSLAGAHRGRTTRLWAITSSGPYAGMTGDIGGYAHAYRLTDGEAAWQPMNMGLAANEALGLRRRGAGRRQRRVRGGRQPGHGHGRRSAHARRWRQLAALPADGSQPEHRDRLGG